MAAKRKRGIKPLAALLFALIVGAVVFFIGRISVSNAEKEFAANESSMPEVQINAVMEEIGKGNYGDIFETTQKLNPTLDSEETYIKRLTEILTYGEPGALAAVPAEIGEKERTYQLVNANGNPVGQEYRKESGQEASNFFQITDSSIIPVVDIYEFDGLLGEPALNAEEGYAMIQDVLSGNWLMGKEITDEELKKKLINAAEQIAMYPAQDTPLSSVAAVSDTSAAWYQKYVSLQNYWFTAHNTMELSNETCKAIAQSDDTIVAQIAFDYFADNGEVSRTWHCGYQLTFRKSGDEYLVCGTEISSLLNPAQPH